MLIKGLFSCNNLWPEEIEQDKITIKKLKSNTENDQISITSKNLINEIKKH